MLTPTTNVVQTRVFGFYLFGAMRYKSHARLMVRADIVDVIRADFGAHACVRFSALEPCHLSSIFKGRVSVVLQTIRTWTHKTAQKERLVSFFYCAHVEYSR